MWVRVLLPCLVDSNNFEEISKVTRSKKGCDILEKYHDGGDKVKQIKLKFLIKMYELMLMEENHKFVDYFARLITMVNQMNVYGEAIVEQEVVER